MKTAEEILDGLKQHLTSDQLAQLSLDLDEWVVGEMRNAVELATSGVYGEAVARELLDKRDSARRMTAAIWIPTNDD